MWTENKISGAEFGLVYIDRRPTGTQQEQRYIGPGLSSMLALYGRVASLGIRVSVVGFTWFHFLLLPSYQCVLSFLMYRHRRFMSATIAGLGLNAYFIWGSFELAVHCSS
jgi:hypothetical protein